MSKPETFEYAIRKDVRNNPIVREVDERRQRELRQSIAIGCVLVLVLLRRSGSTSSCIRHGYQLEQMQRDRAAEAEINRHLAARDRDARDRRSGSSRSRLIGWAWCAPGLDDAIVHRARDSAGTSGEVAGGRPLTRRRRGCRRVRARFQLASNDNPPTGRRRDPVRVRGRCSFRAACSISRFTSTSSSSISRSGSRKTRGRCRPNAVRSSIALAASSPTASTPTPSTRFRARSRTSPLPPRLCAARSTAVPRRSSQRLLSG